MGVRRRTAVMLIGLIACATLAGCGSGAPAAGNSDGVLKVSMPNGPLTDNNNPFITSSAIALGYDYLIYEPLVMTNAVEPTQPGTPWLATNWNWSANYTKLVLTIRNHVTWSDGQPLTAADVAYTFGLLERYPALNSNAIPFGAVTTSGNTVTLTFPSSQFVNQSEILSTFVVPQHQWSKIKDPTTDTVPDPIGTGPYTMTSFTSQTVTLLRRSSYWQALPKVREILDTSYSDNNSETTALSTGATDWTFVFISNPTKEYTGKDPAHYKLWFPALLGVHGLWLNTQQAPLNDPVVRSAMNMAISRHDIFTEGEGGYFYPEVDSITGLPPGSGASFVSTQYRNQYASVNVAGAKKLLTDAGYRYSGSTLLDRTGKPVAITLTDPSGYSDYIADLEIIKDDLSSIGIAATVDRANENAWSSDVDTGNFQATLHWTNAGATPYDFYESIMDGAKYKAIGTGGAAGNYGRFVSNAATNDLVQYADATSDAARTAALDALEQIMVQQVPMIPLVALNDGAEYSTAHWTGWPDAQNPYTGIQPNKIDLLDVIMHLQPTS